MINDQQLWYGFLVAWVVVWLWNRYRTGTLKLRRDNQVGFGVTAILLVINVIVTLY